MQILKFGADWCSNCKQLSSVLDQTIYAGYVVDIDVDADPYLVGKYSVRSLPTLVVIDNEDKPVDTLVGMKNKRQLDEVLSKYFK